MKFFKFNEFSVSSSYPRLTEHPKGKVADNIMDLVENLLDPVRARIGCPITVTSGYRPPQLNEAVGGAKNSNHLYGYAADVVCGNRGSDNLKIVKAIYELGLEFDEVIIEKGTLAKPQWIHVAYRKGNNRGKMLYSPDGHSYVKISFGEMKKKGIL